MKTDPLQVKLSALLALRANNDRVVVEAALRKALGEKSNVLVAKAATIAGEGMHQTLRDTLVDAFDRLLLEPARDPTCRAKEAIAKTLTDFEERDAAVFVRGLHHVQWEAAYAPGGKIDTAGVLRSTCALALVATDIDREELLVELTDLLVDDDKAARLTAVDVIAQLGSPACAAVLRLKALVGDIESEVVGQCLVAAAAMNPVSAISFIARFLERENDALRFEAISVLAQSRRTNALDVLVAFWDQPMELDLRRAYIGAFAASPQRAAIEFLVPLVTDRRPEIAYAAIAAIGASRFRDEFRAEVAAEIQDHHDAALQKHYREVFAQA